jgi:hypothetical protein
MQNDFYLGDEFNYENDVSLSIELDKTCYSKGEKINGTLILSPEQNSTHTELVNPYAKFSFIERQCYEFLETFYEKDRDIIKPTRKNIEEIKILGSYPMNFSKYEKSKMLPNLKIPFQIMIPINAYPSLISDKNTYILHFLTCELESLKVKKSIPFIIKNNPYFTKENKLLKIPYETKQLIGKHKFAIISCGNFEVKINLEKNICPYNENLPITIDIDCSNLNNIKLKGVNIYIFRTFRKNSQKNKNLMKEEKTEEIVRKTLPLREGEITYHIEDGIKLPISSNNLNPEIVYQLLDKNKDQGIKKFQNIKLFPSCSGGLLSCNYFLKIIIETNTLFSTNEEMIIPVDFYSSSNNNKEDNEKNSKINMNLNIEENNDGNLNINQQVFIKETQTYENNIKSNNNNSEKFQILPDDDDDD